MFYFCGKHFIAFKIVASDYRESVNEDAVLFIFKDGNKLLLSVHELDEIIDTSIESCRIINQDNGRYVITNLLNENEEGIEITKSIIFYKSNLINLPELQKMEDYFMVANGFEFDLHRYCLHDFDTNTQILFQNNSINIVATNERIVQYMNRFYFDLAKVKLRDTAIANSLDLRSLDIGGM